VAKAKSANEIASLFLVRVLEQEKRRIQRSLELLAEADEAEDEGIAERLTKFALDEIRSACVFGDIWGSISYKQWKWLDDVASRQPRKKLIVTFEGVEVGFASYSWSTELEAMHYILDPAVVREYMQVPTDVLARAEALDPLTNDLPLNQWMAHVEETKSTKSEATL